MSPNTMKRSGGNKATPALKKASRSSGTSSERENVEKVVSLKNTQQSPTESDHESEEGSLEIGACCLCHSSLDFSDRAGFFKADRMEDYNEDTDNEEDYYFRPNDPYLPVELYDPNNALLYCDGCNRLFHQKCHFCPVTVVPRGEWHCLLCSFFKGQSSPTKRRKRASSKDDKVASPVPQKRAVNTELFRQMQEAFDTQQLFVSPPVATVRHLEEAWEFESRHLKATHFQSQVIKRLRQYVESQASNYRLAETAVITLTSTSKNRSHFLKQSTSSSQELAQTLVKLYGIRKNWRRTCFMLHDLQRSTGDKWNLLQKCCRDMPEDFVTRVLFPFGTQHGKRVEPRTSEAKLAWGDKKASTTTVDPPTEIVVGSQLSKQSSRKKKGPSLPSGKSAKKAVPVVANTNDDDDSGISLDDLQCCVCRTSEATDENDLVLCDGQGCFRAYHAHCVSPALKQSDLEEEVDWFCPYCSAIADILLVIQTIHMGDEWEQERYAAMLDNKSDMESSLQSWAHPDQVFPTAEQDYAAACQMKEGKRNKATDDLLARVLGLEELPNHDDDDEVEDANFDLDSYQKQREEFRTNKRNASDAESIARDNVDSEESGDDDESSHSSQATLVEMSSVELEVGEDELEALSKASSDDDEGDENAEKANMEGTRRRSRRLRRSIETTVGRELVDDIGGFDEANIVQGKRGRKPVDYIRLNEAIFGDVPDEDAAILDDTEEFEEKSRPNKVASDEDSSTNASEEDEVVQDEENDSQKLGDDSVSDEESEATSANHQLKKDSNRKRKASKSAQTSSYKKKSRHNGDTKSENGGNKTKKDKHANEPKKQIGRNGFQRNQEKLRVPSRIANGKNTVKELDKKDESSGTRMTTPQNGRKQKKAASTTRGRKTTSENRSMEKK